MHIFAPCGRWAGPRRRHSRSCRSYDETGKRVRTKKEITDENGQIRKGCTVIKKGDVYESHLFTTKDERFKSEAFIAEAKEVYTDLINSHISDPEQRLKVFDKNSVYLPTKKIGKNNPKTAEIEADNTARQEWNRTADLALVSGIEKAKILEIKQSEIHDKAGQSICENGWLPNLFRGIVSKAKEFLQASPQYGYGRVPHNAEPYAKGTEAGESNQKDTGSHTPESATAACGNHGYFQGQGTKGSGKTDTAD